MAYKTGIAAIAGIVIIEVVALFNGIDGSMLALSFTAIGAIAGAGLPRSVRRKVA